MSTTKDELKAAHASGELSHRQIQSILIGLMLGMFLAALDQNIVGTAIRTIADDLNGYSAQAWVTTAYLITSTITTPIYGKLSDIYGRKQFFLAAIVLFILGSAACSFATSMYMLAAFRAFQGLGAGGLFSLSLAIIGDIVPPRERAKYQGYFLAVFGTSSVLGPIIGGFFAQAHSILWITGWRWVFLVNVPVGIIALIAVTMTLHLHHERREARIDWWGAAALIVCLVPLLTVAEQGRTWGWGSGRSLTCYAIGLVGLLAFIAVEFRMGDDALIPMRIFKNRTMAIAISGGFVLGAGMFGAMLVVPQYLQVVHGAGPTRSGILMLPMVLGIMSASIISGQLISRTGRLKVFPIIGLCLMVVALVLLSRIGADTDIKIVLAEMLLMGLGLGNCMQPLTLAVQAAANPREIGMATSSATFFRQIGGTLGAAIFLSILLNRAPTAMGEQLRGAATTPEFQRALHDPTVMANPVNQAFARSLQTGDRSALSLNNTSIFSELNPVFAHPLKAGFSQGVDRVFIIGAAVCLLGVLILAFLPNVKLGHRTPSAQAAADGEGAEQGIENAPGAGGDAVPADASAASTRRVLRHRHDDDLMPPIEPGTPLPRRALLEDLADIFAIEAGGHSLSEIQDRDPGARSSGSHRAG